MLSMSARSRSNSAMIGLAPDAPSSSTFAFSWRARSAFSVASTGSRFAAFSTRPSKSSVTPFIAETTTARLLPPLWPPMMPATRRIQLASATLVPPNLCTVQVMTRSLGKRFSAAASIAERPKVTRGRAPPSTSRRVRDLAPHGRDRGGVIRSAEDRGARDERVGTGGRDAADVRDLDAAVDLQPDRPARAVDEPPHGRDLRQHGFDELLPAKAGVHRHQQHEIDFIEHVLEPVERRRRVEYEPALAAALAD